MRWHYLEQHPRTLLLFPAYMMCSVSYGNHSEKQSRWQLLVRFNSNKYRVLRTPYIRLIVHQGFKSNLSDASFNSELFHI